MARSDRRGRTPTGAQVGRVRRASSTARRALYLERGGRTALVFTDDAEVLAAAAGALATALTRGRTERMRVESVNGAARVSAPPLDRPLRDAGFRETPRGLRFDARG